MNELPKEGDVIDGTYKIESLLGKGGFGAVYLARQMNMGRDVALKLLVASGPKFSEMVKRFRREVMAIRNLTHPNTVRIYDFRDNPDGLLYYTMEALKGWTLKDEIQKRGTLSPRRLKHVWRQVLKSLSEAHSQNIVHRDLKPANIMLVEMHGETDFVKVLDFGIAKLLQDDTGEGEEVEELTSAGILVGTLRYMAPEQIKGEALGPETDLYALGLIAVEMLTGQSVFAGTGRWEVFQAQISDEPIAIPQEVLDCGLGPVIMGCLQKEKSVRFTSADEVLKALEAIDDSSLSENPLFYRQGDKWVSAALPPALPMVATRPIHVGQKQDVVPPVPLPKPEGMKTVKMATPNFEAMQSGSGGAAKPALPEVPPQKAAQEMVLEAPMEAVPQDPAVVLGSSESIAPPAKVDGKSKGLLAIGGVILIALLVGGAVWMTGGGSEKEEGQPAMSAGESGLAAGAVEPPVADEGVISGEQAGEGAVAEHFEEEQERAEIQRITIRSGDVRARAFVDGELRGRTPFELRMIDETATLRLEAMGYEPLEVVLDRETPGELDLELTPETKEEPARAAAENSGGRRNTGADGSTGSSQASGRTANTGQESGRAAQERAPQREEARRSDWVDIGTSTRAGRSTGGAGGEEQEKSAPSGGGSDWVEIGSPTPSDTKEAEKEKREIPLF